MRAIGLWILVFAAASAADERTGTLAQGTRSETPYYVIKGARPGPCVAIVGGCHGNEPAGALAANQIRRWRLARGRLLVIPRANPPALSVGKRFTPGATRELRDLNRNYGPLPRGAQARRVWSLLKAHKPDWVLDLHEGFDFHAVNKKSVGSSIIVHPGKEALTAAQLMLADVNELALRPAWKFVLLRQPVPGSLVWAAANHLGAHAMTLETTTRAQVRSFRTRQHRVMVYRLLAHLGMLDGPGMLDGSVSPNTMTAPRGGGGGGGKRRARVAVYDSTGTGGPGVPRVLDQLESRTIRTTVERVCATDIRAGVLAQFDCVVFSGGTGSGQARALRKSGRKQVRDFVGGGGGYIGICAGAYLATSGFDWGLRILDAKTVSPKWRRGRATLAMELTPDGRRLFGGARSIKVIYHNGPILQPAGEDDIPDYVPLAFFREEVARFGSPKGVMVNTPAIVGGRFGKGRVLCISPHPEQTKKLEGYVPRAVDWTRRR